MWLETRGDYQNAERIGRNLGRIADALEELNKRLTLITEQDEEEKKEDKS